MTVSPTDFRLEAPLALDLVADVADLYDRLGAALPGSIAVSLEPAGEVDELTTLLPYTHRVADITRLTHRLLQRLVAAEGRDEDLLPRLVSYCELVSGGRVPAGTIAGMLLICLDVAPAAPRVVRDQYLLQPALFATLPQSLITPIVSAAAVVLRVVAGYVHDRLQVPGASVGELVRSLPLGTPS